jgi:hypothetical protein
VQVISIKLYKTECNSITDSIIAINKPHDAYQPSVKQMKITVFGDDVPCSPAESLPVLRGNRHGTERTTGPLLHSVSHGIYSSIPKTGQKVPSNHAEQDEVAQHYTDWAISTLPQLGHNFNPSQFIIHTTSSKATWSRYWQHTRDPQKRVIFTSGDIRTLNLRLKKKKQNDV